MRRRKKRRRRDQGVRQENRKQSVNVGKFQQTISKYEV